MKKETCKDNCGGTCGGDKACQIQQRIFEREVDEELRQERLARLWQKYRFYVFFAVAAVLVGTIGAEWYQAWRTRVSLAESDRFETAMIAATQGHTDTAVDELTRLAAEGRTGYRYLAQMEAAGLLLRSDKPAQGLERLQALMNDTQAPKPLRQAATIAFVGHQLDTGDVRELQGYLIPIMGDKNSAFLGNAVELSAVIEYLTGNKDRAILTIQTALDDQGIPEATRERLAALMAELKE